MKFYPPFGCMIIEELPLVLDLKPFLFFIKKNAGGFVLKWKKNSFHFFSNIRSFST